MHILNFIFLKNLNTLILLFSIHMYCCAQDLKANWSNVIHRSSLNNSQKQSVAISPIQFLTNKKITNQNINLTYLNTSIRSDLLSSKIMLDRLRSNGWMMTNKQEVFFQKLLNSKVLNKEPSSKYLKHCKRLLNRWLKLRQPEIARYFFHAFHLFFNVPPDQKQNQTNILLSNNPPNSGNLASGFLNFINQMYFQSESTLKIYFYQFSQPQIINAIKELAYWLGPNRIKVIVEEDYLHKDKLRGDPSDHSTALKHLLNSGIPVRTDKSPQSTGNGESHHKFSIIEPDQLFTGSWNPTSRGTNRNFNHAFWLQSEKLFKLYDDEFEQIWLGKSQSQKNSHWDYGWININGGRIRAFFSPQDPLKEVIISSIQQAKHKIVVGLFFLTDPDILDLLRHKRSTGVKVQIVMDNLGLGSRVAKKKKPLAHVLKTFKLEHWKDDNAGHWHHKAAVIDSKLILSGSANWSRSAFQKNDENLLQIEHQELATKLQRIISAKTSFIHWNPEAQTSNRKLKVPKYWRIIRQADTLIVQLPPDSTEWQVRFNRIPIKTKISKPHTLNFIHHAFFRSKKDGLLELYHPGYQRLHSLFFSNDDRKLSKKALSLIKSELIKNPQTICLPGNPINEDCLESKIEFKGCREAGINKWKAEPWKNCNSVTRIK